MAANGVRVVDPTGLPFNPNEHQASPVGPTPAFSGTLGVLKRSSRRTLPANPSLRTLRVPTASPCAAAPAHAAHPCSVQHTPTRWLRRMHMQALVQIPDGSKPPNSVVQCFKMGYA